MVRIRDVGPGPAHLPEKLPKKHGKDKTERLFTLPAHVKNAPASSLDPAKILLNPILGTNCPESVLTKIYFILASDIASKEGIK